MSLLATFVAHEATTQFRSMRFRAMSAIYLVVCIAPVAIIAGFSSRAHYVLGSASYAALLDATQPMVTMFYAAILALDAVTRERDEGSLAVVALAPLSAAGYLWRRWLAVTAIALPVTLVPRIAGIALSAFRLKTTPMLDAFAWGWLLNVLPVLVLFSAVAIALGTINNNSIIAIITGAVFFTAGLGFVNDLLAHFHRTLDSPIVIGGFNTQLLTEIRWSLQGYYEPTLPTEAGYPLRERLDVLLPRVALLVGCAALLLGIATIYLRRTRRDLRPWTIREDHQLRSFIRAFNRLRDSYSPDGSLGAAEWLSIAMGLLVLVASFLYLEQRTRRFERLGAQRYASVTETNPLPMTTAVVPLAARVRGALARDGSLRARTELTMRNGGTQPIAHLGFELNPLLDVRALQASRGHARLVRAWQRLGVELDPPLAAGESRTLTFDLDGTPGNVIFYMRFGRDFRSRWDIHSRAKTAVELADVSRSYVTQFVNETRVSLAARDLLPVPRYSPWIVETERDRMAEESIEPAAAIDVRLEQPFGVVADSCGHSAERGALESRCTLPLAAYRIAGGPLRATQIAPGISLANIPAHDALARVQGPALAAAVARAEQAWSGIALPRPIVYLEMPSSAHERPQNFMEWSEREEIEGSAAMQLIPEVLFNRFRGLDEGAAAGALITNALRSRRSVVPRESHFFLDFYRLAAQRRVGEAKRTSAVIPALRTPIRAKALTWDGRQRLAYIACALEARAGASHIVEGINDFVAAGPAAGTARELFAAIGRRAGLDLMRLYDDYIDGDQAPRLTMEDVTFRRAGASWEVRGVLHNDGTGEAYCPLALRTAGGSEWQTVRVDSGARTPFVFTTTSAPRTLQLDPAGVCYREAFVGAIESVDYRGGE